MRNEEKEGGKEEKREEGAGERGEEKEGEGGVGVKGGWESRGGIMRWKEEEWSERQERREGVHSELGVPVRGGRGWARQEYGIGWVRRVKAKSWCIVL